MCPTCEKCSVKYLSDACIESEFAGLFDNSATLFFAIFMSLWGKHKNNEEKFFFSNFHWIFIISLPISFLLS